MVAVLANGIDRCGAGDHRGANAPATCGPTTSGLAPQETSMNPLPEVAASTAQGDQPRPSAKRRTLFKIAASLLVSALLAAPSFAPARDRDDDRWVGTWTASPQAPEPPAILPTPAQFDNQTIRQVVRTSIGGHRVRVRLSNEFGTAPLAVGAVTIAHHGTGAAIVAGSDRQVTFSGRASFTIPAGAPALSDPLEFDVPAVGDLVVSIFLPKPTPSNTFHSLGLATTYVSPPGDYSGTVVMPTASTTLSWFFLSGISVEGAKKSAAIVALGDSITDGYASTPDTNRRWPNLFAARLQSSRLTDHLAVLNHGISGNRTLFDFIGPNAQARLDRDALNAPGAKFVVLLEGINNIGIPGAFGLPDQAVSAEDIIAGHQQLIARAHERGLKIYGGTLTPFEGTVFPGYFTPEGEAKRQAVNQWIRTSRAFDGVIDFDRAIRDPAQPTRMLPAYDSGDHLHPNDAGYAAMANFIDPRLFRDRDD
jgi:lysophospholipase L1-like esterase